MINTRIMHGIFGVFATAVLFAAFSLMLIEVLDLNTLQTFDIPFDETPSHKFKSTGFLETAKQMRRLLAVDSLNSESLPVMRDKSSRTVGFCNLFEKDSILFNEIIKEMIDSLESSGVLNDVFSIEYVYFGPNHTFYSIPSSSPKFVKSKASNSSGNEAVTLQLLHSHCARYPDDRVFYIHSKGSFHPSSSNNLLRRNLLKAVIFCIHSSDAVTQGDVCGLRVSPVPYPQMSGAFVFASASTFSQRSQSCIP